MGDDDNELSVTGRTRGRLSETEVAVLSEDHTHCLVCYSDLKYRGKTPCDHDDICGVCHLRLRFLHDDKKCPICKTENDSIIVDTDPTKSNRDYPRWGDDIGGEFVHRKDVGMFFQTDYYEEEILPLFACACNVCDFPNGENSAGDGGGGNHNNEDMQQQQQQQQQQKSKKNQKQTPIKALDDHLRVKHRLALCKLCVDHKRDFVARLPRFNPRQLQNHLKHGDGPESGFFGHPVCQFCAPKRFYDLAYLHQHLHKEHYKCHVCEKQGLDNQFFKNYKSLERHFDQQHFLCHDVQCLGARFVVFENELDLRAHEMQVHGGTSTGSTKINLEFKTRRRGYDGSGLEERNQEAPSESDFNYGLDGQAFVPQALPSTGSNNEQAGIANSQLHPDHIRRTQQLRAHAAGVRQQQALESQGEAFPTLQAGAGGPSSAPLVGWASGETRTRLATHNRQAGKVTEEDFPTLPTSSAPTNKKRSNIRGNIGATRRQFAAMSTAPSPSHPSFSNAAATRTAQPARTSYGTPSAARVGNRQSDLEPGNFPSLGPASSSSSRPQYTAATALGKKNMKIQQGGGWNSTASAPVLNSASDFPSMPGSIAPVVRPTKQNQKPAVQKPPSMSNAELFPSLSSAPAASNPNTVRNQVMGNRNNNHPQANSNMLQGNLASTSASAKASIEEMKGSLGPKRFKELKKLTKTFSENQLSSEGYVDQCAALFDKGYADPDFWSFLPSLLESTPNQEASERALIYMTSIKKQQFESKPTAKATNASPPISSWGGRGGGRGASPAIRQAPSTLSRPNVVAGKKKGAWGGGGTTTVAKAKASPGSTGMVAASQQVQGGSATKFMAQQQKKQNTTNNNQNKKGKNKKKERDELRALAFGGK